MGKPESHGTIYSRENLRTQIILMSASLIVAFVCFQILNSSAEGTPGGWKVGGGIAGFLITYYMANRYYRQPPPPVPPPEKIEEPIKNPIIGIPSRPEYLLEIINSVEKSNESVLLCLQKLEPSKTNENIRKLQETLEKVKNEGREVRILAPGGIEKVEASYELSKKKGIPIKILDYLNDGDLKFTIVDSRIAIISIKAEEPKSPGDIGVVIRSERLNKILRDYFNGLWNQPKAKEYDFFLSETVRGLIDPNNKISKEKISEILQIPISEIDRVHAIDN